MNQPWNTWPTRVVSLIDDLGAEALQLPHSSGKIRLRGLNQPMVVIGSHTEGVTYPPTPVNNVTEHRKQSLTIPVIAGNPLPGVAPTAEMLHRVEEFQPQESHLHGQYVPSCVIARPDPIPDNTSEECQRFLAAHHITCSLSAVGSCADHAAAESFFGLLKRERVNRRQY